MDEPTLPSVLEAADRAVEEADVIKDTCVEAAAIMSFMTSSWVANKLPKLPIICPVLNCTWTQTQLSDTDGHALATILDEHLTGHSYMDYLHTISSLRIELSKRETQLNSLRDYRRIVED
jgi:hypothetical protein